MQHNSGFFLWLAALSFSSFFFAFLGLSFATADFATADDTAFSGQGSIRLGPIIGNYKIPATGTATASSSSSSPSSSSTATTAAPSQSWTVPTGLDFEYEIFNSSRRSTLFRGTLAYSLSGSLLRYGYFGVGERFYLGSDGVAYTENDHGTEISVTPRRRYFAGGDVGVAQVTVLQQGPVLQAQSGVIDLGGHVGMINQLSKYYGLEFILGVSYGLGFTSVSANGYSLRLMFGFSRYF